MASDDRYDMRRALRGAGLLAEFNAAGVLAAADVHVALRLAALGGEQDERVALAAALAVRGPRLGHVFVDLATIRDTATVESDEAADPSALPWPEPAGWMERVAASPLAGEGRPLRLEGSWLYLDRYWREERRIAADLLAFGAAPAAPVGDALDRLFGDDRQRLAGETALRRRLAVVAGGPGTGKTTTVARIVALLTEHAGGLAPPSNAGAAGGAAAPLVALAAPTGKAAARLEEAVHGEAAALDVAEPVRAALLSLKASTVHRLLGWRPDSRSRFRHHRANRLPHDVVVVDETSMVSLELMARLVEAVRPQARLVLVGDPGQLTSIEAGAVLGDIVAGAREGVVVLERVHRFGGGIAQVAEAIRRGDADGVLHALASGPEGVTWIPEDPADADLAPVREGAVAAGRAVLDAARRGAAREAIDALGAFRLLCAHRAGPHGVAAWTARLEGWLGTGDGAWYVGRPLLVTENDYELRLYNGDTGVVVQGADGVTAAFDRRGVVLQVGPTRLGAVETAYAMTIHKSQGSQFGTAAVLLPPPASRILTRELLYTAATRASEHLIVAGTEETVRAAVARPVARASGLRRRLLGDRLI